MLNLIISKYAYRLEGDKIYSRNELISSELLKHIYDTDEMVIITDEDGKELDKLKLEDLF